MKSSCPNITFTRRERHELLHRKDREGHDFSRVAKRVDWNCGFSRRGLDQKLKRMTDQLKPGTPTHGNFERQDLAPKGILYFLIVLVVGVLACVVFLRGLYAFLDRQERERQSTMSPLITKVPEDTRHVAIGYPQATFPKPQLEEDERGQLRDIRMEEEKKLYSYGWVNEQAGTVRIPIDRAMDLLVQRGLPVRAPSDLGKSNKAEAVKAVASDEAKN